MRPLDVSTEGWRIDSLLSTTNLVVHIISAIVLVWIAAAVITGVRRAKAKPELSRRVTVGVPLAIAAVMLFAFDGYLFYASNRDWAVLSDSNAAEAESDVVRVEINAQQWAWSMRHAGPDGRFATGDDPVELGRLVVPVDTPIVAQVGSSDVVHALWIPNLRIKRDIIPGQIAELWFEATAVGSYPIACAQFCGVSHYKMSGVLEVVSREEYDEYIALEATDSTRIAEAYDEDPNIELRDRGWPIFAPLPPRREWGWKWVDQ